MGKNLHTIRGLNDINFVFRETRIYSQKDVWYYTCPKGNKVGPFRYRSEAKSSLDQFIDSLKDRLTPD